MKVVGALFLLLGLANAGFENFHAHPAFHRSTDESIFTVRPRHLPLPNSFYQPGPATTGSQVPYIVREANLPVIQQFSPINQLQSQGAPVNLVRYVILREYQFDGQGMPSISGQSPATPQAEEQRSAPEAPRSEAPVIPAAPEEQRSILAQPQVVQIPEPQPQQVGGYEQSRAQIIPQPIAQALPQPTQQEQISPASQQEQAPEQQTAAQEQVESNVISSEESTEVQEQIQSQTNSVEPERPNIVFSVIPAIGVDLGTATLPSRAELRAQYEQQQEQQAREAEAREIEKPEQQQQPQAQSGYIESPEQQQPQAPNGYSPEQQIPLEQARVVQTGQVPAQGPISSDARAEQQQRQETQPQEQIQQQQPQQQEQVRSQFQQRPLNEYISQMVEQAPFMQQPAQVQAQVQFAQQQQIQQPQVPFMQYPDISAQMQEAFLRSRLTPSEPIIQSQGYEVRSNFNLEPRAPQLAIPQQGYEQQQQQQQQQPAQIIQGTRSGPINPSQEPQQPQQMVQPEQFRAAPVQPEQFRAAPIPESPVALTQAQYTLPIVQQELTRDDSHHADDNENPPTQEQAAGYNGIEASPAPNPLLRSSPVITRVSDETNRMALDQALRLIADLARAAQRGNQISNFVQQPQQAQVQQPQQAQVQQTQQAQQSSPVADQGSFSITPSVETDMGRAREGRRISPRLIVGHLPQVRAMIQPQPLLRYY